MVLGEALLASITDGKKTFKEYSSMPLRDLVEFCLSPKVANF